MRTIFDDIERKRLLRRLDALAPDSSPRWGRMNASQMVCHLTDAINSSFATSPHIPASGPLTWPPLKQLIIYLLPWPRGKLQSPPDLLVTQPMTWEHDTSQFRCALERVAARGRSDIDWPSSDVFGTLSRRDWGALLRTHINHHFQQFGV